MIARTADRRIRPLGLLGAGTVTVPERATALGDRAPGHPPLRIGWERAPS